MVHKRYRDPSMGYDRNNAREEERAVIEEQLAATQGVESALGLEQSTGASDALARRMAAAAQELRNNDLEADVARDAVAGLDMDDLVGGTNQAAAGGGGLDFGPLVQDAPQPTAGAQAESALNDMGVDNPQVTKVNKGEGTGRGAAKSDGFLSKLMRMLRGS